MSVSNEQEQLRAALLLALGSTDQSLSPADVYASIERSTSLSAEQRQHIPTSRAANALKAQGLDWRKLSQAELRRLAETEPRWKNTVRWAVKSLRGRGLMEKATTGAGWSLTAAGRQEARLQQLNLVNKRRGGGRSDSHPSGELDELHALVQTMSKDQLAQLLAMARRLAARGSSNKSG